VSVNRYEKAMLDPATVAFNASSTQTAVVNFMRQAGDPLKRACSLGYGPDFDRAFLPLMPGELVSIIGLSGNMKSALMQYSLRHQADELHQTGRESTEFVAYVSWEQSVEAMGMYDLSRRIKVPIDVLARGEGVDEAFIADTVMPVFGELASKSVLYLGSCGLRPNLSAPLTLDAVGKVLRWYCKKTGWHCHCLYLDYIQAVDTETGHYQERRLEVRENVYKAKNLAFDLGCPVVMGVQAKQTLMQQAVKLPGRYDGEETSGLAQRSDRILGTWYPFATEDAGEKVSVGKFQGVTVTPNLFFLSIAKQKMGESRGLFPQYVDPETNEFLPADWRQLA